MTIKQREDLIKIIDLRECDYYVEHNNCTYYYYTFGDIGFYILTNSAKERVGMFHILLDDISIHILPEFRRKHYMSNFIKQGDWRTHCKHLDSVTLEWRWVEDIHDYDKKVYLINELLQIPCRHVDHAVSNIITDFANDEDYEKLRHHNWDGKLKYWKDMLKEVE